MLDLQHDEPGLLTAERLPAAPADAAPSRLWRRLTHAWAVITVAATFLLLAIGSVVTTLRVGMADPIWPTYPWHLLLISWQEPSAGFLIEHTHRLAGYVVGCCVIGLACGLWLGERRAWLRWLGAAALAAVIVQGLLGGFRVKLNALVGTDLATIHGCFAQLVFALLAALALFTAWSWSNPGPANGTLRQKRQLRRVALAAACLAYLQVIFGASVRHTLSPLSQRAHVLLAFAVVALVAWLVKVVLAEGVGHRGLARAVVILVVFVALQLGLGVETWITRFGSGVLPELQKPSLQQGLLRTSHFLVGTLVFAQTVIASLWAHRQPLAAPEPAMALEGRQEGLA
jgi:cytochrome c oxidase assembly protein subunit 15